MKKLLYFTLFSIALLVFGCEKDEPNTEIETTPEKVYTQIKINSITLTGYPLVKSNGGSWDVLPSSGPDITFKILGVNPTNYELYDHPKMFEDISSIKNLTFTLEPGKTLQIINDFYFFRFLDYDGSLSPDYMGDISLNPHLYSLSNPKYPTSFSRTQNGITATFNVTWQ